MYTDKLLSRQSTTLSRNLQKTVYSKSDAQQILTVVSSVIIELLVVQVDNVCAYIIKKALVMGHYEESLLPALKVTGSRKEKVETDRPAWTGTVRAAACMEQSSIYEYTFT